MGSLSCCSGIRNQKQFLLGNLVTEFTIRQSPVL